MVSLQQQQQQQQQESFCAPQPIDRKRTEQGGESKKIIQSRLLEQIYLVQQYVYSNNYPSSAAVVANNNNNHNRMKKRLRFNCVFMGMGEPLDNYNHVHESLRGLTHQCLFAMNAKQVTISTVGASPEKIYLLADEAPQVSLAFSLHSAIPQTRQKLICMEMLDPKCSTGDIGHKDT